ncbi:hypothetical protein [Natrinema salifodinae]|uniref:Uncharacterized protein n=1 Tax=Natrinema salifodinae TaxID=1202768 RepID=A0A1I0PPN3_9EURY|nr:hypothetical protein [Natrinema salifodinae]SEW16235.1 hypothetical protein SAMN05216285_2786 [Natrinema salifodinae]
MSSLHDEMADVRSEVDDVRSRLREEIPDLFEFDVAVGNISYNANSNSVSVTVEPSSGARDQLSEKFGGVNVKTDGMLELEFRFTESPDE